MPAVAIPAVVSLAGTAASMIGAHKQQSAQKKAALAKQGSLQGVLDFNYNQDKAFRDQFMAQNGGSLDNIMSLAAAPQVSTSSSVSDEDSTTTQDYGPEGNAARAGLLQTAQNLPYEQMALMPTLLGQAGASASQQISSNNTAARNRAARLGANAGDMTLGLNRGVIGDLNAQKAQIAQIPTQAKQASLGNIQNVLGMYRSQNTKSHGTQRGTQTGGPNLSAMMAVLGAQQQMMAPVHKEFADVQGA
jgi:hypothetical protein